MPISELAVVLYKDATANKGGVTSSHLEVLASLALTDEEWDELMCVKDGKITDFRKQYVEEYLDFIRENAAREFEIIWKENARTRIPRFILSDMISEKINQRVPAPYLKALFASRLAGRYVYKFGLDANEIHFYNFLQEFRKNPVATKLANGPIS
jgi:glutamate dehydrogenase